MAPATEPVSEDRLASGHRLSHPPPGDEVLITGISGYFPDSDSVIHLQENLFNKVTLQNQMAPATMSEDRLTSVQRLSHPPPGDEVLITGVSGYFPDSDYIIHL